MRWFAAALCVIGCGQSHPLDASADSSADAYTDTPADSVHDSGIDGMSDGASDTDPPPDVPSSDAQPDACVPFCGGRTCGPDFCGGLCSGEICNPGSESFEGFVTGAFSAPLTPPTVFASGLRVVEPDPNPEGTPSARVLDCSEVRGGYFGFVCDESDHLIPDGMAFLGYEWWMEPLTFELPADVGSMRMWIATTGSGGEPWELHVTAQNSDGDTIVESTVVVPLVEGWGPALIEAPGRDMRFVELSRPSGTVGAFVVDLISWE